MPNWNKEFKEKYAKRQAEDQARLEQARKEAAAGAKEVFDFAKFKRLYAEYSDRLSDERLEEIYERRYYLDFTEAKTLEEFAHRLEQLDIYQTGFIHGD